MTLIRCLLLSLALIISSPARACDSLVVTGFSYHFDRSSSHNEFNYGLGCGKDLSKDWMARAGFYKNSQYNTSKYLLLDYTPWHPTPTVSVGFSAGYLDGYEFNQSNLMAAPLVKWEMTKKLSLGAVIVPAQSGLVGVFFDFRL